VIDRPPGAAVALAVLAVLGALLLASGTGRATVVQHGPQDAESARAVADLSGPGRADARLPASFLAVTATTGHRPAVVDGVLLDPAGSCSSPVALPRVFDEACRAHDLGYDIVAVNSWRQGWSVPVVEHGPFVRDPT
jgi:hypothetical protein